MQESPRPGKTTDCATDPTDQFMEPRCKRLLLFLEGTDTYMDYRYYFCKDCRRIWESSMFYQDWEPHWTILPWAEFEGKTEKWIDISGKDFKPKLAFENGVDSFEQWILGPDPGLSLRY
jgi:hypothetical protein